ncbi:hypothetical protein [Sphingomonas sp. LaA6.9]|uniref:hypothetical protein n=1 Tax=Sphingomonas sp. LaA6.9 TaxID=2919914 RepID=UPI001F4F52FD|nr:hypothetical protein [Sphingomonas sp. LaA6.9]MCJ8159886.1 hypothetical protein [Sphingomonas sp. LaA6.9]
MARWDGPRSLNPDGLLARIERVVFGTDIPLPLANKRLESLRRFSVKIWFWQHVRERDLRALLETGFSLDDARRILAYIARHRGFAPSVEIWPC